jgi:hypothetical protein
MELTYYAPSPRGFVGARGWYVEQLWRGRPCIIAGPFATEREALAVLEGRGSPLLFKQ